MKKYNNIKECIKEFYDNKKLFEFISNLNFETHKGRYDIDENCFVNVIETQTSADSDVYESHNDYIDIHYMLNGCERLYYDVKKNLSIIRQYDNSSDCELLKGKKERYIDCFVNEAVVFDVFEPHLPLVAIKESIKVNKAIIKIKKKRA